MEIKAIPTKYKNVVFRSRLEARWAVFMDNLGIEWCYEFEGYDLDGVWYLPDFWLPKFECGHGAFLEVKPKECNSYELLKAEKLCLATGKLVILGEGVPAIKCQRYFYKQEFGNKQGICLGHGLMNADEAWDENRLFVYPGYENDDLTISECYYDCVGGFYISAVSAAVSEKFSLK